MANGLTKHQLEIIAEAVLKQQKKQEKKTETAEKDWRLRNTRTLLRHYLWLQKHSEEIIEDLEDYEDIIFDPKELNLHALMKYKIKTKRMMDYFDATWGSYREYCKTKGGAVERRCEVIRKLYLQEPQMKKCEVADLYSLDERTVRRDEAKATQELAVFLFGIDTLADLEQLIF